jgi:hypothetical protein
MKCTLGVIGGMTPIAFAAYVVGEKWQGRNREYQPPAASLRVGDCRHKVGLRRGTWPGCDDDGEAVNHID